MWPGRRAFVFLLISWGVWSFVEFHINTPWGSIWGGTDHLSHVAQVELFQRHGMDIFRRPLKSLCTPASARTLAWARAGGCPKDTVCDLGDSPPSRPVCSNWADYPAPYPPGLFLYSLPDALLYENSSLSLRVVAGLSIVKYLLAAHVLLWLVYRTLFLLPGIDDPFRQATTKAWFADDSALRWGFFFLFYMEILRWTLAGFYDALGICPLFVAVYCLWNRRPVDAFLAYAISVFIQYRALWYLPVAGIAALEMLSHREWLLSRFARAKVGLAIALAALSASVFLILLPSLRQFPQTNAVFLFRHFGAVPVSALDFIAVSLIVLSYLALSSHWRLFVCVLWQSGMILCTPQAAAWHALFLLPLLGVARLEAGYGPTAATLVFIGVESIAAFGISPSWGGLIYDLSKTWG